MNEKEIQKLTKIVREQLASLEKLTRRKLSGTPPSAQFLVGGGKQKPYPNHYGFSFLSVTGH